MGEHQLYDVAVIGGGLGGLALSIQCAKTGYRTILFEKETYPFHKVCGEYVSFESWNFLEQLGVPLGRMKLPVIRNLLVTSTSGKELEQDLPLGGFGISRYTLDATLAEIAGRVGVKLVTQMKVNDVSFAEERFALAASDLRIQSKIVAGAFGKRSNLDLKWKRRFVLQKPNKLNNYVGVKYHVQTAWPKGLIALHNFSDGYCGISEIEDGKLCLCYLTSARNLERAKHSIQELEKTVLSNNPHLKKIFAHAERLYTSPLTISQISFAKKSLIHDHILMIGDAAGMITPLCGNGMSMAMHGSKIAFQQIDQFLQGRINRGEMEKHYEQMWQQQFGRRLAAGRTIQRFFGSPLLSNLLISILRPLPFVTRKIISYTHGQPF